MESLHRNRLGHQALVFTVWSPVWADDQLQLVMLRRWLIIYTGYHLLMEQ